MIAKQAVLISLPTSQSLHCPDTCPHLRGGICRLACGNEHDRCPVAEASKLPLWEGRK